MSQQEALDHARAVRLREKLVERKQWAEYQRTYERCKAIAEAVWKEDLEKAAAKQQALAEAMRDRKEESFPYGDKGARRTDWLSIPVPLLTPRDRLQFLKEATANLMIGTERRGLTVTPEVKDAAELAQAKETTPSETPVGVFPSLHETVSDGTGDEATQPLALVPEAAYGEPVQKAPTPSL